MAKKNIFKRLKVLSRPTGKPQWAQAVRSVFFMVLAGIIAYYLGLSNGLQAVMLTTLIATIIMDIQLPLRKIIPLAVFGLIMTVLAFTTASLGLNSVILFILFTVIWSFFAISTNIFGESVGFFGFIIFVVYFIAVIVVNDKSTTLEWVSYGTLAFSVAALLIIPRVLNRKKELRQRVSVGFIPGNSLKTVLLTRRALSGTPVDSKYYELFSLGTYISGFRGYSKQLLSRLSGENQEKFMDYLQTADQASSQIADAIKINSNQLNIPNLKRLINEDSESQKDTEKQNNISNQKDSVSKYNITNPKDVNIQKDSDLSAFLEVASQIEDLIERAAELIKKPLSGSNRELASPQTSLKEVLNANFNLKNMYIRHALRFTLAMTIGLLLVHLTHDRDVIWVTMGILIIIKPDISSTVNNMIMKIFFNIVAILVAITLGFLFPHQVLLALAFLMLFLFRSFFPTYMGLSIMVLTIFVVFIWPTGTVFDNAVARLVDISLGALIAVICAYVILPSRVSVDLPAQLAKTMRANREYLNSVIRNPVDYDHKNTVQSVNNYLLEENNLESAIKKLDDFFTDITEDIISYEEILAANRKLSSDISGLASFIEKYKDKITDSSFDPKQINILLDNLNYSIDKGVSMSKTYINIDKGVNANIKVEKSFNQYLGWVLSDIELLQELILKSAQDNLFKKYRNLS